MESQPGWQVIGEAKNGRELVERAQELRPHVAVADISMPDLDGISAVRHLRDIGLQIEVVILTFHHSPHMVCKALHAGARGYVLKSDAGNDLIPAVNCVHRHRFFLSPRISRTLPEGYRPIRGAPAITD